MSRIWYPFRPGNFSASFFDPYETQDWRFHFDFDRFGAGATVGVSLAFLLRDCGVIARVKVGGTWTDTNGTTILTVTTNDYQFGGNGNPGGGSANFVNVWSGVQIVKVTGVRGAGPGSAAVLVGGPSLAFKVDE